LKKCQKIAFLGLKTKKREFASSKDKFPHLLIENYGFNAINLDFDGSSGHPFPTQ